MKEEIHEGRKEGRNICRKEKRAYMKDGRKE
jgi:hypothetical protein